MKTALFLAAALTLVVAGGASAQDHPDDRHGPPPHPEAAPHTPPPGAHPGPADHPAEVHNGAPARDYRAGPPAQDFHGRPAVGPDFRGRPAVGAAHFDGFRGRGVGPHGPARVFYHGRSFSSFRAAPFYYPGGWGYRRWGVGEVFPGQFLNRTYFIGNWGAYGLGPPPSGDLQWVRYGPDALLVNVYTGQVLDTAYGVFWW